MEQNQLQAEITLTVDRRTRRYRFGYLDQNNLPGKVEVWIPGEPHCKGEWAEEPKITIKRHIQTALQEPSNQSERYTPSEAPLVIPPSKHGKEHGKNSNPSERHESRRIPMKNQEQQAIRWNRRFLSMVIQPFLKSSSLHPAQFPLLTDDSAAEQI